MRHLQRLRPHSGVDMTTPPELADRVERAEGPSRELDAEIALAVGWTTAVPALSHPDNHWWYPPGRHLDQDARQACPQFTASLDAALTLVPERWHATIHARPDWPGVELHEFPLPCRKIPFLHAATPALALCAAALRARAREGE